MGQATSMLIRQKIVYLNEQGTSYLQLSKDFNLSYNTVRNLCRSYEKLGKAGLQPNYANCGNKGVIRSSDFIHRCSIWLRRLHPSWGADTIHAKLSERYPELKMPNSRTIHRWLVNAGLVKKNQTTIRGERMGN